ncbi:hypothetical protein V8G54_019017 [Vigna mungo]|uniref:Uncharacterized protein n=1 Tax=Vigna mungo TaxID=3915 RepID=A0AAQ3RV95_VIGMU
MEDPRVVLPSNADSFSSSPSISDLELPSAIFDTMCLYTKNHNPVLFCFSTGVSGSTEALLGTLDCSFVGNSSTVSVSNLTFSVPSFPSADDSSNSFSGAPEPIKLDLSDLTRPSTIKLLDMESFSPLSPIRFLVSTSLPGDSDLIC